ncbi:MAG: hypothetical protein ACUVQ1_01150 [Candidatus Kapaibacteriales bacterium]
MKKYKIAKLTILFSLIFKVIPLYSQGEIASSPLGPGLGNVQRELGIHFGIGPSWQTGELFSSCDCPNFLGGSKLNYAFGLIYNQDLDGAFAFGGEISFWHLSNEASYQQIEIVLLQDQASQIFPTPILFRQQIKMHISYFSLEPFFEFRPFDFLFLRFGGRLGFPFNSSIEHTKTLLKKTVQLDNGEIIDLSFNNGLQNVLLEKGNIESLTSPFVSLQPEIGFNFHITGNIFVSISYLQGIPLNNTLTRGKDFKMNYWQIVFDIRYAITMRRFFD